MQRRQVSKVRAKLVVVPHHSGSKSDTKAYFKTLKVAATLSLIRRITHSEDTGNNTADFIISVEIVNG